MLLLSLFMVVAQFLGFNDLEPTGGLMNKSVCQGTRQLTMMEYENRNILGTDQKGSRHDTPKYAAGIGSF